MFDEREPAEPELTPELQALESKLARVAPAAPRVDRDRLMFDAGRAAARPGWPGYIAEPFWLGGRAWQIATALATAASLLLATMLVWQRHSYELALQDTRQLTSPPQVAMQHDLGAVQTFPTPVAAIPNSSLLPQPRSGYLAIRYTALTRGVGAIDPSDRELGDAPADDTQRSERDLLNELLPSRTPALNPRSRVF